MSLSRVWRALKPNVCYCGAPATWSYSEKVDGIPSPAEHFCDECKAKELLEIAARPKPPRKKNHGKKWASVGMVNNDSDSTAAPYARALPVGAWKNSLRRFR